MGYLFDRADTIELDTYATPRRSFYGKAVVKRVVDSENNLVKELYSYGKRVADAQIIEEENSDLQGNPIYITFIVFNLYAPELDATATTRRHIRAFAQMLEYEARHMYMNGTERPTVNVSWYAREEWHTLCDGDEIRGNFRKGQLCDLVEEALHSVPQAVMY